MSIGLSIFKILALAICILSGGAFFSHWVRRHWFVGIAIGLVGIMSNFYLIKDFFDQPYRASDDRERDVTPEMPPKDAVVEVHEPLSIFRDCADCPEMIMLPVGTFSMGSSLTEEERGADEGPKRDVAIGAPFAIGRYEITFAEYDKFADMSGRDRPDDLGWGRGARPVLNVSWYDANAFCIWLGRRTSFSYRLPSEAIWEFAARAGTRSRYAFGNELTMNDANFGDPVVGKTSEVGQYPANAWGLHDMHGNVWEWVEDWNHDDYQGFCRKFCLSLSASYRLDTVIQRGSRIAGRVTGRFVRTGVFGSCGRPRCPAGSPTLNGRP